MGQTHAPDYADIFMATTDHLILETATTHGEGVFPIRLMKRFLDDLFFVFTGSLDKLHGLLNDINQIHENIKFTMSHTKPAGASGCECEEQTTIPFLDTALEIKDGKKQVSAAVLRPPKSRDHLHTLLARPPHRA